MRLFTPVRLALAGLVLLAAAAALWLVPTDSYLFLPDRAHAVGPLVTVEGGKEPKDGGGIFFVAVDVRKASILERLFPGLHEGSTLVDARELRAPCVSESARRKGELREMARSQRIAAAVALRALGYEVETRPTGAIVSAVDPGAPAACKLEPSEIITGVDGKRVRTPDDLRRLIRLHTPGETVHLALGEGRARRKVDIKTVPDPSEPSRPIVGVLVEEAASVSLPLKVEIDSNDVGGPSAGLAFALDLMEELGRDVDRGHRVAATGQINLDGTIVAVGGLKQKTIAARRSGVDVFLVPAGENATEAKRHAGSLRIVPVRSFRQALRVLATLPQTT